MLVTHLPRLLQLWTISARYRLDITLAQIDAYQFAPLIRLIRCHPVSWIYRKKSNNLALALEDMGTLFLKGGQLLSTRQDLVPPIVIRQLVKLQDQVTPFGIEEIEAKISTAFGQSPEQLFSRFDRAPLAAASIAQVHTAALPDGREVVVKVVRPYIRKQILADFHLLRQLATWAQARFESARAAHLLEIVEDYRQIMLNELDLTLEAQNTRQMRDNFLGSQLMYVPEVYKATPNVMIAERIQGVPISDYATLDQLGVDRAALAKKGLTIFFTQVFRDNFFHADMHPGNVYVETINPADPRYIALDCAIVGELSRQDQMVVARMLLAVINGNFTHLVTIIFQAGWIPPDTDQHALARDMRRSVSPMIDKPISEIDFAGVLLEIMDIARRYRLEIPPQLMLLIKTLIHVEGLGRDLYPNLDIWALAKPIISDWLQQQVNPRQQLSTLKQQLPDLLLSGADLPDMLQTSLQGLLHQGSRQTTQIRLLNEIRSDLLKQNQFNWVAMAGFAMSLVIAVQSPIYIAIPLYMIAILIVLWRIFI